MIQTLVVYTYFSISIAQNISSVIRMGCYKLLSVETQPQYSAFVLYTDVFILQEYAEHAPLIRIVCYRLLFVENQPHSSVCYRCTAKGKFRLQQLCQNRKTVRISCINIFSLFPYIFVLLTINDHLRRKFFFTWECNLTSHIA